MRVLSKIAVLFLMINLQLLDVAYAQLTFDVKTMQSYYEVSSYLGKEQAANASTFQFDLSGQSLSIQNWSLSVRISPMIQLVRGGPSKSGLIFPANKISFRWTGDNALSNMNLQNIGANRNDIILQEGNEVMLIERSAAPLSTGTAYYRQLFLYGTLRVAAGKYLESYQSSLNEWEHIRYKVPLIYTLYDENRKVIFSKTSQADIQILPKLSDGHLVDVEPEYSLVLDTEASNVTLRFNSSRDYASGVSLDIPNAIKINAKTNFELRVKSMDAELVRSGGGSLPLSILKTRLTPGTGAKFVISNPELTLMTKEQVLLSGTSIDKNLVQFFNLNYKATLGQEQLKGVKPGDYSLSLLYLLLPK